MAESWTAGPSVDTRNNNSNVAPLALAAGIVWWVDLDSSPTCFYDSII